MSDSDVDNDELTQDLDVQPRYSVRDYYNLTLPLVSGKLVQLNVHTFLRTLVDFLLSHALQLKALLKREIKFSDLVISKVGGFEALIVELVIPKTTQTQFSGCFRHKIVELCPHFTIAMYMFARFHIADTYGELDLTSESLNDPRFHEYKLLNGGNRLRPLSYSQQYKASTKILKITDDFKPINLGKILSAQHNTDTSLGAISGPEPSKPLASSVEKLTPSLLARAAGFDSIESYTVPRCTPPPVEVETAIFPFLDESPPTTAAGFFGVLRVLRRSLVQDMAEVKRRFPDNVLCDHPIFCSPAFHAYAGIPLQRRLGLDDNADVDDTSESENSESPALKRPHPDQDSVRHSRRVRLQNLETLVEQMHSQQAQMAIELKKFVETHTEQLSRQREAITTLANTTNGLLILLTARNANTVAYSKQVLDYNTARLESLGHQMDHTAAENAGAVAGWNARLRQSEAQLSEFRAALRRRSALSRRLIEGIDTIDDMWYDYKDWEQLLRQSGVANHEWVAVQPKSQSQLQNSREAIVQYVETEANRKQVPSLTVRESVARKL